MEIITAVRSGGGSSCAAGGACSRYKVRPAAQCRAAAGDESARCLTSCLLARLLRRPRYGRRCCRGVRSGGQRRSRWAIAPRPPQGARCANSTHRALLGSVTPCWAHVLAQQSLTDGTTRERGLRLAAPEHLSVHLKASLLFSVARLSSKRARGIGPLCQHTRSVAQGLGKAKQEAACVTHCLHCCRIRST